MNQGERQQLRRFRQSLLRVCEDLGTRADAMPGDLPGARQVRWAQTRVSMVAKDIERLAGDRAPE